MSSKKVNSRGARHESTIVVFEANTQSRRNIEKKLKEGKGQGLLEIGSAGESRDDPTERAMQEGLYLRKENWERAEEPSPKNSENG